MIINYLDFIDIPLVPNKADSPPSVDSDIILSQAVAPENFQAVSRRNSQVIKGVRPVEHAQFAQADSLNLRWQFSRRFVVKEPFRFFILETFYHCKNI
jgi:hypothetical protein